MIYVLYYLFIVFFHFWKYIVFAVYTGFQKRCSLLDPGSISIF